MVDIGWVNRRSRRIKGKEHTALSTMTFADGTYDGSSAMTDEARNENAQ
jgi:hypothetical protein